MRTVAFTLEEDVIIQIGIEYEN